MAVINLAPRAFVATPSSILASSPCLPCISETEMLAFLVGIFSLSASKNITDVINNSACFTCMTKKQMLQAVLTIAGNDLLGENTSIPTILSTVKCIRRCSNEKQLSAALLYLLANSVKFANR